MPQDRARNRPPGDCPPGTRARVSPNPRLSRRPPMGRSPSAQPMADRLPRRRADPYARAMGRMFLIAAVARICSPGAKADHVLVFEGPKASASHAPAKFSADHGSAIALPDVTRDKDAAQHLRGKWFIEISELSALSRAEAEALKVFHLSACRALSATLRPRGSHRASPVRLHRHHKSSNVSSRRDGRPPVLAHEGRQDRPRRPSP